MIATLIIEVVQLIAALIIEVVQLIAALIIEVVQLIAALIIEVVQLIAAEAGDLRYYSVFQKKTCSHVFQKKHVLMSQPVPIPKLNIPLYN